MEYAVQEWENKVAILILNYNSSNLTISNVNQIRNLSDTVKIVVVDNCSTDHSVIEMQSAFQDMKNVYLIVNSRNSGYAAGNNLGIKFVARELNDIDAILICNPDIIIPNINVLEEMYYVLCKDIKLGAITVQTIYNRKIWEPNECCWKYFTLPRLLLKSSMLFGKKVKHCRYGQFLLDENGASYVDVVQGCFFMSRLQTLEEVGGFDESTFLYGEEQILAKKFNEKGYINGVIPTLYIYHNHQEKDKSLKSYEKKVFDMKCYFDSRKYYVKEYMDISGCSKVVSIIILDLDYKIKKFILRILKHKK